QVTDGAYPCIDPLITKADVLSYIFEFNKRANQAGTSVEKVGTYLLPQAFPEGSPTHPAYTSGHATVSGACATLLKAFFDDLAPMTNPENLNEEVGQHPPVFIANEDGTALIPAEGSQQRVLLVGNELNKLASNIAIGRNGAGVHWRSDATEGMLLGEGVAAQFLYDQAFTFLEPHSFSFGRFFHDERVTIGRKRKSDGDYIFWKITRGKNALRGDVLEEGEEKVEE
ncbi:MAG TPA: vanadium-dependent haloperoxidase, partial [Flavisolibacter sp.]|nr:vanadium-dependent haloperoxidase [Flavisolibacter sp.]